jgi:hypothetical protein
MNFFRSRLYSVRRPDGFAIRRKKGSTYYARGFVIPYPIDMLATAWLLGIANPQSIKRLGHFLTADCKSAGTPNGGKGISGATEISLWEEDEEQRKEILHLFSTFHSPFVEILESLKDEETEEEA